MEALLEGCQLQIAHVEQSIHRIPVQGLIDETQVDGASEWSHWAAVGGPADLCDE